MHDFSLSVDAAHPVADEDFDVVLGVPSLGGQLELAGVPVTEVLRHVHHVVGRAVLLGECDDMIYFKSNKAAITNVIGYASR